MIHAKVTLFIGILLGSVLVSPEETALNIGVDLTDPRDFPSLNEIREIIEQIDHGTVTIGPITDRSLNHDSVVVREAKPSYWLRSEVIEAAKDRKFKDDVLKSYQAFTDRGGELPKSYFFASMVEHLQKLSKSRAPIKRAIFISDGFENSHVSFYQYRNRPSALMSDYESIIKSLESEYGVSNLDLTGIAVTIVYLPEKEDDALYRAARKLWHRYLVEHNAARVDFVTRLSTTSF